MELNGKTLGGRECLGRKHHSSANFKIVTRGSLYTGWGGGSLWLWPYPQDSPSLFSLINPAPTRLPWRRGFARAVSPLTPWLFIFFPRAQQNLRLYWRLMENTKVINTGHPATSGTHATHFPTPELEDSIGSCCAVRQPCQRTPQNWIVSLLWCG